MSKKKFKDKVTRITDTERQVQKARNSKGKIKGKKKERKIYKGMCNHYKINKHGKLKRCVVPDVEKYVRCTSCGDRIPMDMKPADAQRIMQENHELISWLKFATRGVNASEKSIDMINKIGAMEVHVGKLYKSVAKVLAKKGSFNKNKKRNDDAKSLGGWNTKH
jgi:hypothetical protein